MSKWVVDIHGEIEGDYEIIKKYEEPKTEVIDKIREEIEDLTYYWCEVNPRTVIDDILQIIDKYIKGE